MSINLQVKSPRMDRRKSKRCLGHATNADERRQDQPSQAKRYILIQLHRSNVMPKMRNLGSDAQLAPVPTRLAHSADNHKREAQARGMVIEWTPLFLDNVTDRS